MHFFRHRFRHRNNCQPVCPRHNNTSFTHGNSIYDFAPQDTVQIISIRGYKCMRCQLISMGFIPGTKLKIIENTPNKTCLVSIDNRKITLDERSAYSLIVKVI